MNTMSWIYVIRHFTDFLNNLQLTKIQRDDAISKVTNIAKTLHSKYRQFEIFNNKGYMIAGSYGKGTAIRPPTDVDLLYILPYQVYERVTKLLGNKQSILLQEVKDILAASFPNTDMSADGQVVKVPFVSYSVEVVPCFYCKDASYMICDTNLGGRWKYTNPVAEYQAIHNVDILTEYKATRLIWMLKAWKANCNVDISSLGLELFATEFAWRWVYKDKSIFWYDWMIRDFFSWLIYQRNRTLSIPGISDTLQIGQNWHSKAISAYQRALKACENEQGNYNYLAVDEWQKIFGNEFIAAPSL